ncbi:MAG: hypothetical protein RSE15_04975 [Flavobacterium sp.]|uniref:hypothetical protein n=1 Tax=Flavobacterium sp. TaxID=239 RepID=UPI002B482C57|nr:hypothetical protein [Flavobacterium sp.]WRH74182.1 MAG: hypothetical protein RSE15_04975 [Flavobacterium sp.]
MAKQTFTINAEDIDKLNDRMTSPDKDVEIKGAAIKDALCDYTYELLKGPTKGDVLSHKGVHIIHDDLQSKFEFLNVFFADLDDAYTGHKNTSTIEDLEQEIETENYSVTGFKLSGVEENKSVILIGFKQVRSGSIKFETPKVKLDGNYNYLHQLKTRLYDLIDEVEKYRNGKTAPQDDPNQTHMDFASEDDDFEKGKI